MWSGFLHDENKSELFSFLVRKVVGIATNKKLFVVVISLYAVRVFHAVFLPLPLKNDTLLHPVSE